MINYFHNTDNGLRILSYSDDKTTILGYIYLVLLNKNKTILEKHKIYEVVTIAAEKGYGYKMHELAMDFLFPHFIVPYRNYLINLKLGNIYGRFIAREDINTIKISKISTLYKPFEDHDEWFNRLYSFKEKKNFNFKFKLIEKPFKEIHGPGIRYFFSKY